MKYTLVCKNEPREQGYRAADVVDFIPYEPAPEHMWIECPDDYIADTKWFDPVNNTFKDFPPPPELKPIDSATSEQPITTGTQTI
jgi:hypothetical protein